MQQPLDTEERLLQAAKELWRESGMAGVTTRGVALRAGVNEVTLFRHFGSKDALLGAMVDHVTDALDVRALVFDKPGRGLEEDLRERALAYLEYALPVADVLLLSLFTAARHQKVHPWHAALGTRVREALAAHLTVLADGGSIPPGPFDDMARHFYGSLLSHVLTVHVAPPESADAIASSIARTYARAITGGSDGPGRHSGAPVGVSDSQEGEDGRVEHP